VDARRFACACGGALFRAASFLLTVFVDPVDALDAVAA
jgi:hypothetical protein